MLTDTYKAVSSQFYFARVHSYFVKQANLPINYNTISDFSPIWNNRSRRSSSRNLNNRGTVPVWLMRGIVETMITKEKINITTQASIINYFKN